MEKTLNTHNQSDEKVMNLETQIGRMKQHQELMQQRLKEEAERKSKLEVSSYSLIGNQGWGDTSQLARSFCLS